MQSKCTLGPTQTAYISPVMLWKCHKALLSHCFWCRADASSYVGPELLPWQLGKLIPRKPSLDSVEQFLGRGKEGWKRKDRGRCSSRHSGPEEAWMKLEPGCGQVPGPGLHGPDSGCYARLKLKPAILQAQIRAVLLGCMQLTAGEGDIHPFAPC